MATTFKKSEFFNGKYEKDFEDFLQLVAEDLKVREFPKIVYRQDNPPIKPLVIREGEARIKNPDRIAEEIASILNDFDKWKKEESGIIVWLYTNDKIKLSSVILTTKDDGSPRLYTGCDEEKYNKGIFWFWAYSFFYDYVVCNYFD